MVISWKYLITVKNIILLSHMTIHVMELTWLGELHIITHLEVDLSLIIHHLTYLTFLVYLPNQPFKSTYAINFLELVTLLACGTLLPQTYIRRRMYFYLLNKVWFRWLTFLQIAHLLSRGVYHCWAFLGGITDESYVEHS